MAIGHHPDVIVSETSLPGFDGFALCELLHIDAGTSGIPFMFITADATPGNLARAQRSGADAVLTKPCRPAKLLDAVEVLAPGGQILDRSQVLTRKASDQVAATQALLDRAATQRMTLKKAHHRGDTTTPPSAPPELRCELCDGNLDYVRSHIGGVSIKNPEQWDYYVCPASCGHFEYRVRTRKLRKAPKAAWTVLQHPKPRAAGQCRFAHLLGRHALLQLFAPVQHDRERHRCARPDRRHEEKSLAVRGHVADDRAGRSLKERRRRPDVELLAGDHLDGHHFPVRCEIKELAAIPTPAWCGAAAAGHQHAASPCWLSRC